MKHFQFYRVQIFEVFENQLHDDELRQEYFQEDSTTDHTDFFIFGYIKRTVFKHRIKNLEELRLQI